MEVVSLVHKSLTLHDTKRRNLKAQDIWPLKKTEFLYSKKTNEGFAGGAVVENLPANAGDTGSSPGLGRSHMPQSS